MRGERGRTLKRRAAREARKLMRRGMAAGLVAIGACSDSHVPAHDAAIATADASTGRSENDQNIPPFGNMPQFLPMFGAASGPESSPSSDLSADVVASGKLARNVLYSWTTQRQVAELRANPILLTRWESSTGKQPQTSTVIAALAEAGDPLGVVLAGERFKKGRYAWSNAWATVRGWPGESYGDHLLRIVLKPEAWIAIVSSDSVRVIDMNDADVEASVALANPERIGAVYYVNKGDATYEWCGSYVDTYRCALGTYREYVVNNESMVLEWSLGTQDVLDEIERGIDVATAFRADIASNRGAGAFDECDFSMSTYCAWQTWSPPEADSPPLDAYRLGLAMANEYYLPTLDNMDALIDRLKETLFTPDPFEHKP